MRRLRSRCEVVFCPSRQGCHEIQTKLVLRKIKGINESKAELFGIELDAFHGILDAQLGLLPSRTTWNDSNILICCTRSTSTHTHAVDVGGYSLVVVVVVNEESVAKECTSGCCSSSKRTEVSVVAGAKGSGGIDGSDCE